MLKILSIGNSFSSDAQRYLKSIADLSGVEIYNENLYIGGCSLERHASNIAANAPAYLLERFGESTEKYVSIDKALKSQNWDVVTLQEASPRSFNFDFYEPHLSLVAEHARKLCPTAKIAIHETWAYEDGSEKITTLTKYAASKDMFEDIKTAYAQAKAVVNADIFIPAGESMYALYAKGYKMHRDGFHASLFGRYAIALTWIKTLFGKDCKPSENLKLDESITEEMYSLAEAVTKETVAKLSRLTRKESKNFLKAHRYYVG